jgi:hypothetical protein
MHVSPTVPRYPLHSPVCAKCSRNGPGITTDVTHPPALFTPAFVLDRTAESAPGGAARLATPHGGVEQVKLLVAQMLGCS